MEPNSREFYKQCAFQKFCNTVLHNEACDTHRELRRHKAKEVTFWVTAVTVVTAVLGCPLPIAVTVTLIPCMTVMTMVTVFLGYSLARAVTVMPPFFYPKPQGVG